MKSFEAIVQLKQEAQSKDWSQFFIFSCKSFKNDLECLLKQNELLKISLKTHSNSNHFKEIVKSLTNIAKSSYFLFQFSKFSFFLMYNKSSKRRFNSTKKEKISFYNLRISLNDKLRRMFIPLCCNITITKSYIFHAVSKDICNKQKTRKDNKKNTIEWDTNWKTSFFLFHPLCMNKINPISVTSIQIGNKSNLAWKRKWIYL